MSKMIDPKKPIRFVNAQDGTEPKIIHQFDDEQLLVVYRDSHGKEAVVKMPPNGWQAFPIENAPEKLEGWVNLYPREETQFRLAISAGSGVFKDLRHAKDVALPDCLGQAFISIDKPNA